MRRALYAAAQVTTRVKRPFSGIVSRSISGIHGIEGHPLEIAARGADSVAVKLVLDRTYSNSKLWPTALHKAVASGKVSAVSLILFSELNPVSLINSRVGRVASPFIQAVAGGYLDTVLELLEYGADVNGTKGGPNTPLTEAIRSSNIRMMKLLFDFGAQINVENSTGETPIHAAIMKGDRGVIDFLIRQGADLNQESNGKTPLMTAVDFAIAGDTYLTVLSLINAGADLEKQDEKGWTALAYAVHNGDTLAATILLGAGAEKESVLQMDPPIKPQRASWPTDVLRLVEGWSQESKKVIEPRHPVEKSPFKTSGNGSFQRRRFSSITGLSRPLEQQIMDIVEIGIVDLEESGLSSREQVSDIVRRGLDVFYKEEEGEEINLGQGCATKDFAAVAHIVREGVSSIYCELTSEVVGPEDFQKVGEKKKELERVEKVLEGVIGTYGTRKLMPATQTASPKGDALGKKKGNINQSR